MTREGKRTPSRVGDAAARGGGADDDRVGGDDAREVKSGRWDETWMFVLLRVVVVVGRTDGRTNESSVVGRPREKIYEWNERKKERYTRVQVIVAR